MMLFGVFCLVAFASALPAPQSSELIAPEDDLHVNVVESSAEKKPEILSPIPPPPTLEPIGVLLLDDVETEEQKGSDEHTSKNEEEEKTKPEEEISEIGSSNPDQVVVSLVEDKPPSFISSIFSNLPSPSWPTWSFQIPSFNFGNLPYFSNIFGGRQVLYTNPNYRYAVV